MTNRLVRHKRLNPAQALDEAIRLHQEGKLEEAALHYAAILKAQPRHFDALHLSGVVQFQLGRADEGLVKIQSALKLQPTNAQALSNLGLVLRKMGRAEEALTVCDKVLAVRPDDAEALFNRGTTLRLLKRPAEALGSYDQALAIRPDYAEAHNSRGNALRDLGRSEEALACYDKALALRPVNAEALYNRGIALRDLRRSEEALVSYNKALAIQPDFAEALLNRGLALGDHGEPGAEADFEHALRVKPDLVAARIGKCMAQLPVLYRDEPEIAARRSAYARYLDQFCTDVEEGSVAGDLAEAIGSSQPFYLAYQGQNDRELQRRYGALACRAMADSYPAPNLPPPPGPGEKVRVGIVSGFFRHHTVWKMLIRGWLSQLDRAKFEIFGYHTQPRRDDESEFAAASCDRFVRAPLSLARWREEILADAPHVLIYPEIGMDSGSAQLAAQRLAPVQCVSYGHPNTTGYPTIDYFLSGALMEPPDGQDHYTERLVRLPNLSIYYDPPVSQAVTLDRAELGLRPGGPVFWCGQSLFKYLPQFDQVFPRIAGQVGDCQFVFFEAAQSRAVTVLFKRRLERAFAEFGLKATDYCVIVPRLAIERFVATIGLCDVALDSLGFTGGGTTLDCLTHDIPIVTMPGRLMRGRQTTAVLQMMGVTETIAGTVDDYVSLAVRLARDPSWRNAVRRRMAENKHRVYRDRECIAALETFLGRVARGEVVSDVSVATPGPASKAAVEPIAAQLDSGFALHQEGKFEEAALHYAAILSEEPEHFDALHLLGVVRFQQGRHDEGLEKIQSALKLNPTSAAALSNLGRVLAGLGRFEEALAHYDKALAVQPDHPEALNNRGIALRELGRPADAIASYNRALAVRPRYAEALNNRGAALQDLKRFEEARASYDMAIAVRPDYASALNNRGLVALLLGDFAAGWTDHEHRWGRAGAPPRRLIAGYPVWQGQDLRRQRIIVYEEQGLGDIIQFSRFLPLLGALGAEITFLVRPSMQRLLRSLAATVQFCDMPPSGQAFDYQIALMSLPWGFGVTPTTVPAEIPYLRPEEPLLAKWRQRIGDSGLRIGICWQGNPSAKVDFGRSIPLRCFRPLAAVDGARLISLQRTHGLEQLSALPAEMKVETLGADVDDGPDAFVDTAAITANLDLVITSDTSIAHLAGALGRPVWVVLRHVPDWRWMLDRADSPWYPTARLFRQLQPGDWGEVFERVAAAVRGIIA